MHNYESLSIEDARKLMDEKVSEAYAALSVAQAIVEAIGGDVREGERDGADYGWMPSSQSC